ncbi:hypothetical protein Tco_1332265 [Tanacetum coccineum]
MVISSLVSSSSFIGFLMTRGLEILAYVVISMGTSKRYYHHAFIQEKEEGDGFSSLKPACNSFVSDERIIWISLKGLTLNYVKTKLNEIIDERVKVIMKGSVYYVHAKEMEAWDPFICNDSYESESSDDEEDAEDDES